MEVIVADRQNHGKEGAFQLPLIGNQGIGGEGREIHRQSSGADRDDEGVFQANPGTEHILAGENLEIALQIAAKHKGNGAGLDAGGVAGGVNQHDDEGEQAQASQENTQNVGKYPKCLLSRSAADAGCFRCHISPPLSWPRASRHVLQHAPSSCRNPGTAGIQTRT